ncbi:hypothetical protein EV714DRAFT_239419 [Schizophyllum commune]
MPMLITLFRVFAIFAYLLSSTLDIASRCCKRRSYYRFAICDKGSPVPVDCKNKRINPAYLHSTATATTTTTTKEDVEHGMRASKRCAAGGERAAFKATVKPSSDPDDNQRHPHAMRSTRAASATPSAKIRPTWRLSGDLTHRPLTVTAGVDLDAYNRRRHARHIPDDRETRRRAFGTRVGALSPTTHPHPFLYFPYLA